MTKIHFSHKSVLDSLIRSKAMKISNGWTRESGSGFIVEDILSIARVKGSLLIFHFTWGTQRIQMKDLNLRETEESIQFLKTKR